MSWHFTTEKIGRLSKQLAGIIVRAEESIELTLHKRGVEPYTLCCGETYLAASETVTLIGEITIPAEWDGFRVHVALEISGCRKFGLYRRHSGTGDRPFSS